MITYAPLKRTLSERGMVMSDLRAHGLHPTILTTINRNKSVALSHLDRICVILGVPIEQVVQIILEKE